MKLFGVVGNPVKHSISPRLHEFWYKAMELDARYVALEMADTSPVSDLQALARSGFLGLNITLPYKTQALACAAEVTSSARKIGAANTLTRNDSVSGDPLWKAHNTDLSGFLWSLDQFGPTETEEVVLIGAGGAARAVAAGLNERGYKLIILNRTIERAESMVDDLKLPQARVFPIEAMTDFAKECRLVVNTISLGHSGGALELPTHDGAAFVDISYGTAVEETLKNARASGWRVLDGLPMLVGQAADAFKLWFDVEPDRLTGLKACREWTGTQETLPLT